MAGQKFFTQDDVIQVKSKLESLPDLKTARLTKSDVLSELKAQIVSLYNDKGYTVEDIRSALETAGFSVGVKAIREIIPQKKFSLKRSTAGRKKSEAGKDKDAASENSDDASSDN